jgi:hypothetical protein
MCPAGCGGSSAGDRAQIVQALETGRSGLLAGDGSRACGVLTPEARRRVLAYTVDFDDEGDLPVSSPRVPHACEDIVRRERAASRPRRIELQGCLRHRRHPRRKIDPSRCVAYGDEDDWVAPLRSAKFTVTSVSGHRARAELVETSGAGNRYAFDVVKLRDRWRIAGSSVTLPSGH